MKNHLIVLSALVFAAALALPQTAGAETYSCNGDPLYARAGTGKTLMGSRLRNRPCMADSQVMSVIPGAAKVTIVGEMDGWYKVKFGNSTGWVGSRLIQASNLSEAKQVKEEAEPAKKEAPAIAYSIVGVNERSYGQLLKGDKALLKRLKGKIVLRVESRGELYNVTTSGIKRLLVKTLEEIDETSLATKTEEPKSAEVADTAGTIALTAKLDGAKATLSWTAMGADFAQGFKLVKSEHAAPVYPGDDYHYLSNDAARSDVWESLSAGKTWHFRVCRYLGGKCGVYSNEVTLTVPGQTTEAGTGSISLNAQLEASGKVALTWSLKGMTSSMGFKVVKSEHAAPVYPGDDYHYLSDANVRSDSWEGLDTGVHHFRVCEYLGGKCGVYSNDFELTVR